MAGTQCPDERTLAALAQGEVDGARRVELEAHVAECSRCRDAVSRYAITPEATRRISGDWRASGGGEAVATPGLDPSDLPRIGDVIADKYRVDGVLGRGGMGVVLSARHLELGHRVAIKVLRSNDPHAAERFLREAQTAVQLKGEHIVRVFDLGRLSAGSPYFVMELLEGEDLAQHLQRGPVPIETAVRYLLEICEALSEAHEAGVVHRDLKPANLFLVERGHAEPQLKVLDFGLSKWLQPDDSDALGITAKHDVMGSPLYMSPEQVRASRDVDARTDLWSLGVILYELVSGRLPFAAASTPAIAVRIATSPPEPLPDDVPRELQAIILRCLQKDPAERYASVAAFASALREFRALGEVRPSPSAAPNRGVRWAIGLTLIVTAVAGLWLASTRRDEVNRAPIARETSPPPAARPAQPPAQPPDESSVSAARKPEPPKPRQPARDNRRKSELEIGDILPP
ncbi:MAG TPA: protein kinase [Polyangiales bacterium]|nr:protein kinase [Polyangiales bacterium]